MTTRTKPQTSRPATHREDMITLLGGTWLIIGLFYSGFIVTASWIAWMAYRRASAQAMRTWLPAGYGLAATGVGIFSLGGIGDGIWHHSRTVGGTQHTRMASVRE